MKLHLVLLATLAAAPALAQEVRFGSSPAPVGSGARALGIGASFIATADDATAASWNPSGLIALEMPEASVVLSYKRRDEEFSGIGVATADELQTAAYPGVNYASLAYPFKLNGRSFVAALNFQTLIDFDKVVKKTYFSSGDNLAAELFVDYRQQGSLRALAPALAFQMSPELSVGLAATIWTDKLGYENGWKQREAVTRTVRVGANTVTSSLDARFRFSLNGAGVNFGFLWDASSRLTVGGVVKSPVWGTLTRERRSYTSSDGSTALAPEEIDETLRLPPSYGLGAAYRHSDELTVSFDVSRTEWSLFRQTVTEARTGDKQIVNPISAEPYDDATVSGTVQAHVGVEKLVIFERTVVPLRAGAFYDPEPARGGSVQFAGVALGTGISLGDTVVDACYHFRTSFGTEPDVVTVRSDDGGVVTSSAKGGTVRQHLFYVSAIQHF
jgi:long-subunit fatty acid transport protein